jgi:hypothetical protein
MGETIAAVVSAVVAVAALAFTIHLAKAGTEQNRRDLFLSVHERLCQEDAHRGRRILWDQIGSEDQARIMRRDHPEEWRQVVHAIAMLDMLGLYVRQGYIDKDLALKEWGSICAHAWEHGGKHVLPAREADLGWRPWRNFEWFGQQALMWHRQQHPTP